MTLMTDQIQLQQSIQADAENIAPECPVGESQCDVIDELMSLRNSVAELEQQNRTDALTGLFNFKHFSHCLSLEMERTRRTMQSTALLMIDLDYFKQVNDDWGHEAGNQVLIATAQVIRANVRQLDIACRYGGEEFAIILPTTDLLIALKVAERIRAGIESELIKVGDETLRQTASLGVDVYSSDSEESSQLFIDRVDGFLYQAKEQGRNRICHGLLDSGVPSVAVSKDEREALSDLFGDNRED